MMHKANPAVRLLEHCRSMSLPVKAALWFTVCSIIQKGISVISMPIFTRLMSPDQYGQYSLYMSWYSLLAIVVTLNLAQEVFNKGLSDHEKDRNSYVSTQFGLVTFLSLALLLVYIAFRDSVGAAIGLSLELVVVMFAEAYSGCVVNLWCAEKRFVYRYKPIVVVTVLISVLSVVLGILLVYFAEGEWKVLARAVSNAIPPRDGRPCLRGVFPEEIPGGV